MAAMVKTYRFPPAVAGGAVDPTAQQMVGYNRVVVDVASDAAGANEDPVAIGHHLGCATADGSDGSPEVNVKAIVADVALTNLSAAFTDADTVTLTKIIQGGGNTAFTWRVVIERPHSIGL